jgi:TetR/AcrR family transcriptional repressor of nem operon
MGSFLRALDRYIDDALTRLDSELDPRKSALAGVRKCLAGYVDRTSGSAGKRGCLLVATAMELAAHNPEVEQRIRRFFRTMETRMTEATARAQASGELAAGVDPRIAAPPAGLPGRRHACRRQDRV